MKMITNSMIEQTMARLTGQVPSKPKKQPMRVVKKKVSPFGKNINHNTWISRVIQEPSMNARIQLIEDFLYIVIGEIGQNLGSDDRFYQAVEFLKECDKTFKEMQKHALLFDAVKIKGTVLQYAIIQDLLRYKYFDTARLICRELKWNYNQSAFPEDYISPKDGLDYLPFLIYFTEEDGSQTPYSFSALFHVSCGVTIGDRYKSGKSYYTVVYWCGEKAKFALKRDGEKTASWFRSTSDLSIWEKIGNDRGIIEEYHRKVEEEEE